MPGIQAAIPAFGPALPEIVLAIGALGLVLVGAYRGEKSVSIVTGGALGLLVATLFAVLAQPAGTIVTFNGSFIVDGFARFMKIATLIGSGVALAMSGEYLRTEKAHRFEYPILILLSTLGMMMLISAGDLIALYLG